MGWGESLHAMSNGIKAILVLAKTFEVGEIWWCEDCERRGQFKGGFVGVIPRKHYRSCRDSA